MNVCERENAKMLNVHVECMYVKWRSAGKRDQCVKQATTALHNDTHTLHLLFTVHVARSVFLSSRSSLEATRVEKTDTI